MDDTVAEQETANSDTDEELGPESSEFPRVNN